MHVVTYHFPSNLQLGGAAGFEDQLYSFCIPCECSCRQHGPALQVQKGSSEVYVKPRLYAVLNGKSYFKMSKTVHIYIYMVHAACRMHGA